MVLLSFVLHVGLIVLIRIQPDIVLDAPAPAPLTVTVPPPPPTPPTPPVPEVVTPPRVIAATRPSGTPPPFYVPPAREEAPPTPAATPRQEPPPMDFASMLEARRQARAQQEAAYSQQNATARAGEREMTAAERADAAFKRNTSGLGSVGDGTSGIFQIRSKGTRYGVFSFRGWTNDRSNSKYQMIEVDAGIGGDVELAMVRRMIELIRTHYQTDFNWESHRLGRVVVLSARPGDTAGLEAFLMREFFG